MNIPTLLVNEHCHTGENPLWHPDRRCLFWTDIPNGKLFRYDAENGTHATIYEGLPVGGFTLQENGDLLLFRVNDVVALREDGSVLPLIRYSDPGMERFNDVIADPEGRVFAGTIGATGESGGLYRVDLDGGVTKLWSGTGCANGMGFSPDLRMFYWTCSTRRRIYRFQYDRVSGGLSDETIFYQAAGDEGIPDGLCVDNTGHVWSARWDGYAIVKHGRDGKVRERIAFPVAKVSSACFGGRDLDALYVTTAGGSSESLIQDGALYSVEVDALGVAEFRSRILL